MLGLQSFGIWRHIKVFRWNRGPLYSEYRSGYLSNQITQGCAGFEVSIYVVLRIQVFWVATQTSWVVDCRRFESTLSLGGNSDLQDQEPLRLVTSQDAAMLLPSEPPTS